MIRYSRALADIEAAVEAVSPGWLGRAVERTALFERLERYAEAYPDAAGKPQKAPPFWSEVKSVFMRRQHNKCVYCESQLEGGPFGSIQWDLEHFRPKGSVRAWPGKKSKAIYDFPTGGDAATGYYLLAYHLQNYAAACKTCNSLLKSDHFPISAGRVQGGAHPDDYAAEGAYLVYPLGTGDQDPEELVTFDGAEAVPLPVQEQDDLGWRRARVNIDFFGLNRDSLVARRAEYLLCTVWPNVIAAESGDEFAGRTLERIRSGHEPFASCSRCFLSVCEQNRDRAIEMVRDFEKIVEIYRGEPAE